MSEWIPVSERLPEDEQDVLVCCEHGYWLVTFYDYHNGEIFWDAHGGDMDEEPQAWMPIPPYKASPTGAESEDKE